MAAADAETAEATAVDLFSQFQGHIKVVAAQKCMLHFWFVFRVRVKVGAVRVVIPQCQISNEQYVGNNFDAVAVELLLLF